MLNRVLFVDDDTRLLETMERNFCFDLDLATADSGIAALEKLKAGEEYSVVVSDMRMPRMNGVEFIQQARKLAFDTVYIMLTGNQDVVTAMQAVNDGQVFRFLNKPCKTSEIRRAIDAAQKQYQLVAGEKELLQKTFVGSVSVLTDVLDSLDPNLTHQSQRVDSIMKSCEDALGVAGGWEYRLAARLGLLGLALLPNQQREAFRRVDPSGPEGKRLLEQVLSTSARLIERIPRLGGVVQILQQPAPVDGSVSHDWLDGPCLELGVTLLRVAIHWTAMIDRGGKPVLAMKELENAYPELSTTIRSRLLETYTTVSESRPVKIGVEDFVEGMVLYEDLVSRDGTVLARNGQRLTHAVIEKLRLFSSGDEGLGPVAVVESSCPEHSHNDVLIGA